MSYLAVCWPANAGEPAWLRPLARAMPETWREEARRPGLWVATGGAWSPAISVHGWGLIIGTLAGGAGGLAATGVDDLARALLSQGWGAYVALIEGEGADPWSVLRDPSGGLEAIAWTRSGALILSDVFPDWLAPWGPETLTIDWDGVGDVLADPALSSAAVLLSGLTGVTPGSLWSPGRGALQLWTPAHAAQAQSLSASELADELPRRLDVVVGRLGGDRALIELSGGLDSAIVAASLAQSRKAWVGAVNYFTAEAGGDERIFARAIAERLQLEMTEAPKAGPGFDLGAFAAGADGVRPPFNALDYEHDLDIARRCQALGVDTLLTGQGGDHLFFQVPTALIAADMLGKGLSPSVLARLARRLGRSAWSILAEALKARLGLEPKRARPAHLREEVWWNPQRAIHPWLADLDHLPPAKALQVASLANTLALVGPSRRGQAARLFHPLLSQPMMEACLPAPIGVLTGGGSDRALARQAFADRLPAPVVGRLGKGKLTSHYGRAIAAGLPQLRPLLLEGRLAQKGLLDTTALATMLTPEHLAISGGFGAVLSLAGVELWARHWEGRIGRGPSAPNA